MGIELTPEERFEVWGTFRPEDHAKEAEERWGGTDAYAESNRRVARYTKDDWLTINTQSAEIVEGLAAAMAAGEPAEGETAMDLAERHRQHLSRWFYECTYEIHRGLGTMYVDDPRFAANYETVAEGLAAYLRDAVNANAARAEAGD